MDDRSRCPLKTANKISEEIEQKIVEARLKEPAIGAVKTRRMLINEGLENPPCASTINAVFSRNGLITKEASQSATHYARFEKKEPNIMWQADFKGDFAMGDGNRCHPLSIIDDCTRYCLNADAKANMQYTGTKESFVRTFEEFGIPKSLLCDNGVPWGSSQTTSITHFEVWLMELGVLPIHIRPLHPQCQGKVEKFNGSYKRERLKYYVPKNLEDADICRQEYKKFYNEVRPHHSLELDTPASRYKVSFHTYSTVIPEWEYESGSEMRNIKSSGYITYNGHGYYLSEGLGNKTVAIVPSQEDGVMNIIYRQFRVAKLDLKENIIRLRRIYLLHGDPRSEKSK
jgi:transposase InsO family protein